MLVAGAGAQLWLQGIVDIAPPEDEVAHTTAQPINGKIDPQKMYVRQVAIVKSLAKERLSVLVLGGSHDLRAALREHAPEVELVTITLQGYALASGEK